MNIKKIVNIAIITLVLLFININNALAVQSKISNTLVEDSIQKKNMLRTILIIMGIIVIIIVIFMISTLFKDNNMKKDIIDYNSYLNKIINNRKIVKILMLLIVFILPIMYILNIFYTNIHIITG